MKCNLKNRDEIISAYAAGNLPDNEAAAFESHYFSCEYCYKELKAAEEAIILIKQEGNSILRSASGFNLRQKYFAIFNNSSKMKWGAAAAVAAILLFTLLIMFPVKRSDNEIILGSKPVTIDTSTSISEADSVFRQDKETKTIISKNEMVLLEGPEYEPSAYMEEWIHENLRSENDNIDTVYSPKNGDRFTNQNISFNWKGNAGILRIINNSEEEILKTSVLPGKDQSYKLIVSPERIKNPGLYYWHIETKNEVVYTGKFYILYK